jgi:hypothetical protein
MKSYDSTSARIDDCLYQLCSNNISHEDRAGVWAKVLIIGRSFSTRVEAHTEELSDVVDLLVRSAGWLDPQIAQYRRMIPIPTLEKLTEIAPFHGKIVSTLSRAAKDNMELRSFSSKYLHFHAPIFPIYDSIANEQLRNRDWYPWKPSYEEEYPAPTGADVQYWRHCVRVLMMAREWPGEGFEPTSRNIDHYVMRYATSLGVRSS